jgi:hypothetical protein
MKINDVKELTIGEFLKMCEQEKGEYQIDTPEGWKNINFLVKKKDKECFNITVESGISLECSCSHKILTNNGWKRSKDLDMQRDLIFVKDGEKKIIKKQYMGIKDTFDLQVDSDEHRYFSNDIISHNCGKSLICKAIAQEWNMPLIKLDMGKLFDSLVGASEARARDVISRVEAVSPCILWIDEVEKGLSGVKSSGARDGGTTSRVMSTILTWMQEKTSPVFVVATANDQSSIPPEFMRAGRFDEIFFVDYPTLEEREEIFRVHLSKRKYKIKDFDVQSLADSSKYYSGAEIEKAIDNAMVVGFSDKKRKIITEDILLEMDKIKTLYDMRKDELKDLRTWAKGRCIMANRGAVDVITTETQENKSTGFQKLDI